MVDSVELISGGQQVIQLYRYLFFASVSMDLPILDILRGEFTHYGGFVSFFFHLTFSRVSMLYHVSILHSFLRLNNIHSFAWGDRYFFFGLFIIEQTFVLLSLWLSLGIMLQWTILSSFCGARFSFLLSTCWVVEFLPSRNFMCV